MMKKVQHGFTLAELLIGLTLLGLIAAFTIPKLLDINDSSKRLSTLKESYSSLAGIFYWGKKNNEISAGNYWDYMKTSLNAWKSCEVGDAEGCTSGSITRPYGAAWNSKPSMVLHNGTLIQVCVQCGGWDYVMIDWNGDKGPNTSTPSADADVVYFVLDWSTNAVIRTAGSDDQAALQNVFQS